MWSRLKPSIKSFIKGHLKNGVILYLRKRDSELEEVLINRCIFFLKKRPQIFVPKNSFHFFISLLFNRNIKLLGDDLKVPGLYNAMLYNVDYKRNHHDAWVWHTVLFESFDDIYESEPFYKDKLFFHLDQNSANIDSCHLFGTGPSLLFAKEFNYDNSYRIVCNTIVKDKALWHFIKPNLIVAGDALYHYSDSDFAKCFRRDLKERLFESPDTFFVFPKLYFPFLLGEFKELENQLIPIALHNSENIQNLRECFKLPSLGNVLNLLLLPIGISLSKEIFLLGFDGKAPGDDFFWKNPSNLFYEEEFKSLVDDHPQFFNYYVPKSDPTKYVKTVHGDLLETELTKFENMGYNFTLLKPSFTPTLNKRYKNGS
jgi:hypothetical protein